MKNQKRNNKERDWHLFDAKNKVLGRLATEVATILSGKNKVDYLPYLDKGDFVVVVNAKAIMLSGKKENQKNYFRHSGYPGGLRSKTSRQIRDQKPEELVRHAVIGMLPKNRLARQMIKKLYVFPGSDHPYQDKFDQS